MSQNAGIEAIAKRRSPCSPHRDPDLGGVDRGRRAALHPERVTALVLLNVTARYLEAEDYPIGMSSDVVDGLVETVGVVWGTPDFIGFLGGCRKRRFVTR